jgi:glycosyltransferase involved in cell wall biosynthesis
MLTKETDSCVVAEALLHEVIVLAFPVGALPENYGDNIIWIPFPSNANIPSINDPKDTLEPELVSEEVINSIQQIIYELDANPSRKEDIRKRGKQHVKDQRNLTLITNQFLNLLNQQ